MLIPIEKKSVFKAFFAQHEKHNRWLFFYSESLLNEYRLDVKVLVDCSLFTYDYCVWVLIIQMIPFVSYYPITLTNVRTYFLNMSEFSMHLLSVNKAKRCCCTWCCGSHLSRRFGENDTSLEDRPPQSHIERIRLLIEDTPPWTTRGIESSARLQSIAICMRLEKS